MSTTFRPGALLILALAWLAPAATPQSGPGPESGGCLACHASGQVTVERDGLQRSGLVEQRTLDASVHVLLDCVDCHSDLIGIDLPDDPDPAEGVPPHPLDLARVNCGACHEVEDARHAASSHGQAWAAGDERAPSCADCHGSHAVLPSSDLDAPTSALNIPATCGQCHREGEPIERHVDSDPLQAIKSYSLTMHGEGLFQRGLSVTAVCTSCHTAHDILPQDDPRSSIHADNMAGVCTSCHGQIERVHEQVIDGERWAKEPHTVPSCTDCHRPHVEQKSFVTTGASSPNCQTCHASQTLSAEAPDPGAGAGVAAGAAKSAVRSLYVDQHAFDASVHADIACAQCHSDVQPSLERPCETATSAVDCSVCHAETTHRYRTGTHGTLWAQGDPDAPTCADCHSTHAIRSKADPESPTFPTNVTALCSECHAEGQAATERSAARNGDTPSEAVALYLESIHGAGLAQGGLLVSATCSSCHGSHGNLPADHPESTVAREHVASTCGACHFGVEQQFNRSVHGAGVSHSNGERAFADDPGEDKASCKDCHSSHSIRRSDQSGFQSNVVNECGACHAWRSETFFETVHGKATRLGGLAAAKCQDCHGSHEIRSSSDPASTLSRQNIVATCGKCHEGSHEAFTSYLPHATYDDPERWPFLFATFWSMTALLGGTMTVALLHTLLFLIRLLLDRPKWKAAHHALTLPGADTRLYRRFDRSVRTLHLLMVIAFLTLATTGMTLKFSYAPWAQSVNDVLGGPETMKVLHRVAGLLLIGVFLWHLRSGWAMKRESGLSWLKFLTSPRSIVFNLHDLKEARQTMAWFVGRGPRPAYRRFTYWEKFDYMAVFWGVAVIGGTGFALWFPVQATHLVPGWMLNVANIIHADEALLAVAFIFTVHFFNANLRPDKFPVDMSMFTGRVPVDELKFERPGEYEDLVARGELEKHIVAPLPRGFVNTMRVFAVLALFTGLALIAAIVVALLMH